MSDLLRIFENEVQIVALFFLLFVYILRIVWLFRFKSRREKTLPEGNAAAGVAYSMLNVAMPWAMESARKKPLFYFQFVLFHLGITFAIAATFIIPYWPQLFTFRTVVLIFQSLIGAAFLVGLFRLCRRLSNPSIRLISSLDDYFSLVLMILYFAVAFLAIPNDYQRSEWLLILFFALTAFLLIYVPFSKIGHYLYYPFTRFFLGRTMGHRGVFAKKKKNGLPTRQR
jgi:nitrate reductase gamma subunit